MQFKKLVDVIVQTQNQLQARAIQNVNQLLTIRNWLIGFYIVEYEQSGKDRAKYGDKIIPSLAEGLKAKKLKGLDQQALRVCRHFYTTYPQIRGTLSRELQLLNLQIPKYSKSLISKQSNKYFSDPDVLLKHFSYSHFVELLGIEEPLKRYFYETQAIKGNWSVRELKRQVNSMLYERVGLSEDKKKVLALAEKGTIASEPKDLIKDPYIFEFLDIKEQGLIQSETDLEKRLLDHLQEFLLELGQGFCFEARQKRFTIDGDHYYIDLVFYHRYLKCHVLIDLKTRKFTPADAGQMNFYLNYFKDQQVAKDDNPPIGIILCAGKNQSKVTYALAGIDQKLFVSKYKTALPSEKELLKQIGKDL